MTTVAETIIGYGKDAWCVDSISTTRFATGRMLVAQALYRRLTTPRGTLRGKSQDSQAYGYDLVSMVGAIGDEYAALVLPSMVRAECLKDDRVRDVAVTVTQEFASDGTIAYTIAIDVALYEYREGFTLTLGVADAKVSIIGGLPQ